MMASRQIFTNTHLIIMQMEPEEGEIVGDGDWHDVVNKRNKRRPPTTKRRITPGVKDILALEQYLKEVKLGHSKLFVRLAKFEVGGKKVNQVNMIKASHSKGKMVWRPANGDAVRQKNKLRTRNKSLALEFMNSQKTAWKEWFREMKVWEEQPVTFERIVWIRVLDCGRGKCLGSELSGRYEGSSWVGAADKRSEFQDLGARNPRVENTNELWKEAVQELSDNRTKSVGEQNDAPRNLEGELNVNGGPHGFNESEESSVRYSQFLVDDTNPRPTLGNNIGPISESFWSSILRPSKTLTKKAIPDLNLSDEVCREKSHLDDTTRGVEDVSQTEDWSEESDKELIVDENKGLSAQEVGKEVADTIKVGQGVGIQLDGFEERVTELVAELVNQNRSQ
ncbi:hypothetical protein L1987_77211 [Smallanthus sonchifolius]|uniref:Uncharacterized protein n=1 Tax=Smallanthus sonchifolius TaxID=185202 RepID=A0ACB8ZA80_9ASTR|nr:hypothetical protein L1987_77211 [Smallanthus sonchifolius]